MKKKVLTTKGELKALEDCSALTWEGLTTSDSNLKDVEDWLNEYKVDTKDAIVNIISGATMNTVYELKGNNRYPDDLNIVAITGIDTAPVTIARFQVGARWFNDIVSNNAHRNH